MDTGEHELRLRAGRTVTEQPDGALAGARRVPEPPLGEGDDRVRGLRQPVDARTGVAGPTRFRDRLVGTRARLEHSSLLGMHRREHGQS